ncbi:hypothetical protein U1872_06400 [Sphingomonas sp. RB3P16]|uniref:hypothetical protein n=1 Tax=Parasphingomonas frigoris TaxID=3096163 RepID=UPI002FC811BC
MGGVGRFFVVGAGAFVLLAIVLMTVRLPLAPVPQQSRAAQIDAGCQREFAAEGADRVADCVRELDARELIQIERDKMARAAG